MSQTLDISDFIDALQTKPVFDVRSPGEFQQGHIPGAHNIPLFENHERAAVGTLYKQVGRDAALKKGLEYVGPKMREFVEEVEQITDSRKALVHCWRGGMRSNSFAWLLETAGFEVARLKNGYKAYRNFVLDIFSVRRPIIILGGHTGSGKTEVLQELKMMGEQVIDLEGLANHKGSAFGHLGEDDQPTGEQFQNELGLQWYLSDPNEPVWVEDESRLVGARIIPKPFFEQMRKAPVVHLNIPQEDRIQQLIKVYSQYDNDRLSQSVQNIQKRLGGLRTKQALQALEDDNYHRVVELVLSYYDDAYDHGLSKRDADSVHRIHTESADPVKNAEQVLKFSHQKNLR